MKLTKADPTQEAETLFRLDNAAFNRDFDLPSRDVVEQKNYLRGSETYVLSDQGKPVGFFAIKDDDNGVEIKSIVVTPNQQGKGCGRIMMEKILELTRGKTIHLVTHPKNVSAIRFYLKSGFEIYGWKDNYYGDGEPRLLLRRVS